MMISRVLMVIVGFEFIGGNPILQIQSSLLCIRRREWVVMGRFAHFYKALKFKTCRTLLSNVWDKELTLIQRRILGTLRNEKHLDTQVSRKQNSIAYIKLQTARKLNLFYRNMRSTEWKKGRSQRYIPFLLHLETRLDVLLVRIHFCENLVQARQLISHGKVCVNHAVTNKIHWKVSPGSVISFKEDAGITQQTEVSHCK